ncbi:MAG: hypothetical protein K2W96_05605 [Gemmataceae bacterium]|nr:hypothetical protein [Gemmataceae bacterium]
MSGGTRGLVLAVASWAVLAGAMRAADIETRDFAVLVSGKHAGEVHMTIEKDKAGAVTVRTDTDIKVAVLLSSYKYIFRGRETWKDKRLARLDSNTDDNGKRYLVSAAAGADGLKVKANDAERTVKAEAWTDTYWSLPDPKLRDAELTVLDADSGKDATGKLAFVATEKHRVAGQEVTLNHYRFTGKSTVELWYDGHDRLVRREWTELGHKTTMVLVRVRR